MKQLYNYINAIDYVEYYWSELSEYSGKKAAFGPGEWMAEPDHIAFTHEETGFNCAIYRDPELGYLSGFIEMPYGHIWHGNKTPVQMDYSAPNKQLYRHNEALVYGGIIKQIFDEPGMVMHSNIQKFMCTDPESWVYGYTCNTWQDLIPKPPPKGTVQTRQCRYYRNIKYVMDGLVKMCQEALDVLDKQ